MWEQNNIAPGIYIVSHAYVIKFLIAYLKHRAEKKHRNAKQ